MHRAHAALPSPLLQYIFIFYYFLLCLGTNTPFKAALHTSVSGPGSVAWPWAHSGAASKGKPRRLLGTQLERGRFPPHSHLDHPQAGTGSMLSPWARLGSQLSPAYPGFSRITPGEAACRSLALLLVLQSGELRLHEGRLLYPSMVEGGMGAHLCDPGCGQQKKTVASTRPCVFSPQIVLAPALRHGRAR